MKNFQDNLFNFLRRHRRLYDISYSIYDFMFPVYLYFARKFSKKFSLERKISRVRNGAIKQGSKTVIISNGVPYTVFHGRKFLYVPESRGGSLKIFDDLMERQLIKIISSRLDDNSVFMDVGANVGFFSIFALHRITAGKIYCFEPVSQTFEILSHNISLNSPLLGSHKSGVPKILFPEKIALSDVDGHLFVTTSKFGRNHLSKKSVNTEKIKSMKLDTFVSLRGLKRIDVIKADIEGAELLMLRGAELSIRRFKPVVVLEIQENWTRRFGYSPKEIFEFFRRNGYFYSVITDHRIIRRNDFHKIDKDLGLSNNFMFEAR